MYSNRVRDDVYKLRLRDFIQGEYGLDIRNISVAKRGFYGETWKASSSKAHYFLKLVYANEHMGTYKQSLPVIQHLCDQGIDFIGQIVKTKRDGLWAYFDDAVLGVFEWIEGENIQTDETKIPEYEMLAKVYTIPYQGLDITWEDFSNRYSDEFWVRWGGIDNRQITLLIEQKRKKLEHRTERLKLFSTLCSADMTGFVITHGDAGGNFFVGKNKNFILDWDGVMLAPPERDAWVMCGRSWVQNAFHKALCNNGIAYKLRPQRLAYYCYQFFFYYLNSFIAAESDADVIAEFLDGWIEDSFRWADAL